MVRPTSILPLLLVMLLPAAASEIPGGAHLLLRMVNSVNTRTAQEGDYVYLRTASPIVINDQHRRARR